MPKYEVLVNGRFGEGWGIGDIVEMDEFAASVPLEKGELRPVSPVANIVKEISEDDFVPKISYDVEDETFYCSLCRRKHEIDSKNGQACLIELKKKPDTVQMAHKVLKDAKKILDGLGIVFWLDGGTLLGAHRDKDFCKDDEDDIDLCTWINYKDATILAAFLEAGFTIHHEWETQYAFRKNGIKIDLFFNMKKGKNAYTFLYSGDTKIPVVIPAHFYEELKKIRFDGKDYNAPRDIEEYLELKYGDWKTPVHRSQYSCYSNDNNKVVRKDFNYD